MTTSFPPDAPVLTGEGSPEPSRHLPLAGTYNVRDVGGYLTRDGGLVRWRTLFRADSLHRVTPAGQATLLEHGLRTIVDLRRDVELADAPNVFTRHDQVEYVWISLSPDPTGPDGRREIQPDTLARTYRAILDDRQHQLWRIFTRLAEPGAFPALVHCTAGKDRTGLVVALLLELAGVDRATVAGDYALTASYLNEAYRADARLRAETAGHTWEAYQLLLGCPAELMLETLAYLDGRYGGAAMYLLTIGLHEAQLAALRGALLGHSGTLPVTTGARPGERGA
jgi:protein-tyrosine phosphatase